MRLPLIANASIIPPMSGVDVLAAGDHRTVFLNGHLIARFACGDRGTERVRVPAASHDATVLNFAC